MTSQLLSKELRASLATAATRYEKNLHSDMGEGARAYLVSRGIPLNVARDYRLGVVDGESPDHPEYAGWLAIPYLTRSGVVSFKFRNLYGSEPKYIGPYESRLYNTLAMDAADRSGILGIAEGEFDAIVNTALVGIPTVGIPGFKMYSKHPEWRELFRGYQEVLIFKDNDKPREGEEMGDGDKLAKQLRRDIDTSRIVRLPSKDINDTYQAFGAAGVLQAAGLS